jgi:DNA polymerase
MCPEVPDYWYELENAVARTLDTGEKTVVSSVTFEYRKPFLLAWLATGRPIFYFKPRMQVQTVHTGKMVKKRIKSRGYFEDGAPEGEWIEVEEEETYQKRSFTYMGQHQVTRKWVRIASHGGRTTEQVNQAHAREVLKKAMIRCHGQGYPMIGTSHDEIISLIRKGDNRFTLAGQRECMTAPIPEFPGLPLGASGYVADFYRKD